VVKDESGSVVIDRDGTHFRIILNYLRDGTLKTESLKLSVAQELLVEAQYYQLDGLVALLTEKNT